MARVMQTWLSRLGAHDPPYVLQAGGHQGLAAAVTTLAFAWGDMSSNFIQPFWSVPPVECDKGRVWRDHGVLLVVLCGVVCGDDVGGFGDAAHDVGTVPRRRSNGRRQRGRQRVVMRLAR